VTETVADQIRQRRTFAIISHPNKKWRDKR
jgi:peptide subunit release factor RF-3